MIDISVSYNRYKFLGYEFLTWVWFIIEKDRGLLSKIDPDIAALDIGNRIVLENKVNDAVESITIKGDDAGLEEGVLALRKGAVVTELNLIYKSGDNEWKFTVKGESFHIANLKTPETGPVETGDDIEGMVLEKIFLYDKIVNFTDNLYKYFIKLRLSTDWNENVVLLMKDWIHK
ncbi:Uncharacterized protein dnl_02610 [Desulfonema limicola]|uniref:Uncharacterized protein n=1 Tax=Desulfonema limicola TaxID=45656 RepID=A0A975B3D3_9BACT|nr:hypothetical protein [Desulfonema limicola]QTA78052.1 Uncharacterized protein dnl_02610 [Desulfonema limicola]